jgi:quercetin dioxygenase-like cupin family protein
MRMRVTGAVAVGLLAAHVLASRADAQDAAARVKAVRVLSTTTTVAGQPIALPKGDVEVIVWTYDIPPGARLPVHKHPFPRYAYVLAGTLHVATSDNARSFAYKTGDFIVEMIDVWHYGINSGDEPVRLLVIDQVEVGRPNTILR